MNKTTFADEMKRIVPEVNDFLKNKSLSLKDWKLKSGEHLYLQKNEKAKEVELRIFEKRGNWYAEPRIELSIPYSKIDQKNFNFLKIVSMGYKHIASFYKVMAEDLLK